MILSTKFAYYFSVVSFTFLASFLLAIGIISVKRQLTFYHKINYNKFVFSAAFIYFFIFSILSILKYSAYNMAMVDLGRMSQAVWNTLHGRFLVTTFESGNASRLIAHSEFIYLLIAPVYMLFPDPRMLLLIQSLIISLGAFPVYRLAKIKIGGNFTPFCFSLAYLLYPSLQYGNLLDFHPDMLATTFLLFTFYFLEKEKWARYFIFLLLSVMCKEYVSLVVIMLGLYILLKHKNKRFAGITLILGIVWFFMAYKALPWLLGGGKEITMVQYYADAGPTLGAIIKNTVFDPLNTVSKIFTIKNISILILLFLPLGFLSFLNLTTLLIGLPIFAGVMLSPFFSYTNHHNGTIIPFIFISAIFGCSYLIGKLNLKLKVKNVSYAAGVYVLTCGLLSGIFYGPSPLSWRFWAKPGFYYWNNIHYYQVTRHDKIADKFIKMVPEQARVSASNHLASHLSNREIIYHFPYPDDFSNIDCVLVDTLEYFPFFWLTREGVNQKLKTLFEPQSGFSLVRSEDGLLLFLRNQKPEVVYVMEAKEGGHSTENQMVATNKLLGGRLELTGYSIDKVSLARGEKFRIHYFWKVSEGFSQTFSCEYFNTTEKLSSEYIVIDTLSSDRASFRIIHLPMHILNGPDKWRPGEIIEETMDFYVPDDIPAGNYLWSQGLYIAPRLYFINTTNKGLVPDTEKVKIGEIKIK